MEARSQKLCVVCDNLGVIQCVDRNPWGKVIRIPSDSFLVRGQKHNCRSGCKETGSVVNLHVCNTHVYLPVFLLELGILRVVFVILSVLKCLRSSWRPRVFNTVIFLVWLFLLLLFLT